LRLDRSKVAIVVAGTKVGGEGEIVIEEAVKRGFDVIGTPVEDVNENQLSPKITTFIESGKTWETRNHVFIHLIDALITAGDSRTILNHIEIAAQSRKPVFHLKGLSRAIDAFVNNLDPAILIEAKDAGRVIETIGLRTTGGTLNCRDLFGR
jgi:hypothetical protein